MGGAHSNHYTTQSSLMDDGEDSRAHKYARREREGGDDEHLRLQLDKKDQELEELRQKPQGRELPCYKMDRLPRGICLIINNEIFEGKTKNRTGTNVDAEHLRETFTNLHFNVEVFKDQTSVDMIRLMTHYSGHVCLTDGGVDHSDFDCFVCCILTHGSAGKLLGVDNKPVEIVVLTGNFRPTTSPTLKGKPKIFFLQACQGTDRQPLVGIEADEEVQSYILETIPNEADFLIGYSTVPGFVSYRSRTEGSWYITQLTEILNKYGSENDIMSLLTLVNNEVSRKKDRGEYGQVPAPMTTLRKRVLLKHMKQKIPVGLGRATLPPALRGVSPEVPTQNNIPGEASRASCVPLYYYPRTEASSAHFLVSVSRAGGSVCKIIWSNGMSGSGFLVGRNKLITACHVVREQPPVTKVEEQHRRQNRRAMFNFDRPNEERFDDYKHLYGEFTENPILIQNPGLDIAILQLAGFRHKEARVENHPPPLPLQKFKNITEHKTIYLSGHPDGGAKSVCHCRIKQFPGDTEQQLRQWSHQTLGEDIYPRFDDPNLIWYDALSEDFEEGSAGCPGFIPDGQTQEACVTVVHTSGYRPGRHQPPPPPGTVIPTECQFEEGVRIEAVWHFLYYEGYRDMCNEIFPFGQPQQFFLF